VSIQRPKHAKRLPGGLVPPVGCKLVDYEHNAVAGMHTYYWLRQDGKITVQQVQDVDPYLAQNVAENNSHSSKGRRDYGEGLGTKVASIPMGLVEQVLQDHGVNLMTCSEKELKRFLNDPKYAKVRTAPGRV